MTFRLQGHPAHPESWMDMTPGCGGKQSQPIGASPLPRFLSVACSHAARSGSWSPNKTGAFSGSKRPEAKQQWSILSIETLIQSVLVKDVFGNVGLSVGHHELQMLLAGKTKLKLLTSLLQVVVQSVLNATDFGSECSAAKDRIPNFIARSHASIIDLSKITQAVRRVLRVVAQRPKRLTQGVTQPLDLRLV